MNPLVVLLSVLAVFLLPCFDGAKKKQMRCKPRHHYWKPYVATGDYPKEAFSIGVPKNYSRQFVARIMVPYKNYSRLVPAQVVFDHVESPSIYGENHTMESYDHGIEILHVDEPNRYKWLPVYVPNCQYPYKTPDCKHHAYGICQNIYACCCLVEGGITYHDDNNYQLYHVGRVLDQGKVRIGRVVMRKKKSFDDDVGISYLSGWDTKYSASNFDVLAYDCNTKHPNCSSLMENMQSNIPMTKRRWYMPTT